MPVVLLIIGIIFLTAAVRNTQELLFATLKDDFTGPNNFIYWGLSIFVITFVGYYKPLKPLSNAFLVLVIIVLFLSHDNFFEKFMQEIGSTTSTGNVNEELAKRFDADRLVKQGLDLGKSLLGV